MGELVGYLGQYTPIVEHQKNVNLSDDNLRGNILGIPPFVGDALFGANHSYEPPADGGSGLAVGRMADAPCGGVALLPDSLASHDPFATDS